LLDASIITVKKVFNGNFDKIFERLDKDGDRKIDKVEELTGLMFSDFLCPLGAPKLYEEI